MPHATIVSPDPSNQAGGVERVCMQLGDALGSWGWEVSIVGPERMPTRWQSRLGLGYPVTSRSATAATRAQPRPDLIVTNGFLGLGCPRRIPRVHIYHGTMIGNTRAQAGEMPARERLRRTVSAGATEALAGCGATRVCVAESTAEEVHRYYRLRTDAVIANGVDTDVFAPRDQARARQRLGLAADRLYALFVGRLERRKGSDLLIEGARSAGYDLLVAGASGVPGTRHLGILAPDALAEAYAASDCVLFPTRYEACSLVVLEALACGRPLLSTQVGWMRTLLRAVPQYRELCIEADHGSICARLGALADMQTADAVAAARGYVLEHNSLQRWSERWRELVQGLVPWE